MNDALNQGDVSYDARPEIWGRGLPGETFTLYADKVPLGSVTTLQNGFWSFVPQSELPTGEVTLYTRNLHGDAGSQFELSINPHDSLSLNTNADDYTAVEIVDYVHERFSESATLIGTGPSHEAIQIMDLLSGQALGQAQTDEHGLWMFPVKLDEGSYQMVAQGAGVSSTAFGVDLSLQSADANRFTPSMFIRDGILLDSGNLLFATEEMPLTHLQGELTFSEPNMSYETTNGVMVSYGDRLYWPDEPEYYDGSS